MDDPDLLFGNYLAREPLARGGFGQVYRGEHRYLSQRIVAIKVMRDAPLQTQEERDAFLREASLLELLKHPSILPILDVGIQENVPYLVTEYAPAGSLRQRLHALRGQRLPLDEALHILHQIAAALHFAHGHQVIHRDLKPDNILFNTRGETLLADFGIATVIGTASYRQTRVIGTPAYMAPEQFRGHVCKESDQYALACLAYELLTGRPPFANAAQPLDFYALMFHHVQELPPPPTQFNPNLPEHISATILKALAKDRTARYPDMQAFSAALQMEPANAAITQTRQVPPMQGVRRIAPTQRAQPNVADVLKRADELLDQEHYEEAIVAYNRATQLNPNNADAYHNKGIALSELGRYEEAIVTYEQAIQIDPTYVLVYNDKGKALNELDRNEEAIRAFDRAVQLDPTYVLAYTNKGVVLEELGRYEEAIKAYNQAIQLNPNDPLAYVNMGIALEKAGHPKEAKKAYHKAHMRGWEE